MILLSSLIISQNFSTFYTGSLSFTYSGTMNGEFNAGGVVPDSLSGSNWGTATFVTGDTTGNRIFIPALQPSPTLENAVDLFILYMTDDGGDIEPQEWSVEIPDPDNPEAMTATMLFIPELDSSAVIEIITPILEGEVDSTNASEYLFDVLTSLIADSYLPMSGTITLNAIDTEFTDGSFSGTLFQAGFPPPMITISGGMWEMTAPQNELTPNPPSNLTAELLDGNIQIQWEYTWTDTLTDYATVHRQMNTGAFLPIEDIPFPQTEFIDTDTQPGSTYSYYLTAMNIMGLVSSPSDTVTVTIPGGLPGDVNADSNLDVLDIVLLVNFILGNDVPNDYEQQSGDMNGDGNLDVLDIVLIVNIILGES